MCSDDERNSPRVFGVDSRARLSEKGDERKGEQSCDGRIESKGRCGAAEKWRQGGCYDVYHGWRRYIARVLRVPPFLQGSTKVDGLRDVKELVHIRSPLSIIHPYPSRKKDDTEGENRSSQAHPSSFSLFSGNRDRDGYRFEVENSRTGRREELVASITSVASRVGMRGGCPIAWLQTCSSMIRFQTCPFCEYAREQGTKIGSYDMHRPHPINGHDSGRTPVSLFVQVVLAGKERRLGQSIEPLSKGTHNGAIGTILGCRPESECSFSNVEACESGVQPVRRQGHHRTRVYSPSTNNRCRVSE